MHYKILTLYQSDPDYMEPGPDTCDVLYKHLKLTSNDPQHLASDVQLQETTSAEKCTI